MRPILVAGNWKLNGSKASITELITTVRAKADILQKVTVAVCAPYIYLPLAQTLLGGSSVKLGAQDVAEHSGGAFTGEVSAVMLQEFGCEYVIVGHSERRALFSESDAESGRKYMAAQQQGLIPVLCVGETLSERESGQTEAVVSRQLDAVLALAGIDSLRHAVIAYEPVWAIGTGRTASPEQAQMVHAFIRSKLSAIAPDVAAKVQILYGGSVKGSNAAELFAMPDIDGGLIGGASLNADDFLAICVAGEKAR